MQKPRSKKQIGKRAQSLITTALVLAYAALVFALIATKFHQRQSALFALICVAAGLAELIALNQMTTRSLNNHQRTQRTTLSGLLLAMMLVLGFLEHLLPDLGLPGIKLGLSNGVLIFAIYMLDVPIAWILMIMKVTISAVLFGGVTTMMYALAGGVLSMLGMTALSRIRGMHPVTVSVLGGTLHNVGQVIMYIVLMKAEGLYFYMAVLMVAGAACGALTGVCANSVMKRMKHFKR